MPYRIRQTTVADWQGLKDLRLTALSDPVAPLAFFESYEVALSLTRDDWERRASPGRTVTFVGEPGVGAEDGALSGMVVVLPAPAYVSLVGVYLRPGHRGTGLAGELMRAAISWCGGSEVRLHVHERNERAARFYHRLGFRPTGSVEPVPHRPEQRVRELSLRPAG